MSMASSNYECATEVSSAINDLRNEVELLAANVRDVRQILAVAMLFSIPKQQLCELFTQSYRINWRDFDPIKDFREGGGA